MVEADQEARTGVVAAFQAGAQPDSATVAHLQAVDAANLARSRQIVRAYGWPDHAQRPPPFTRSP
jgi:hypothetical protein